MKYVYIVTLILLFSCDQTNNNSKTIQDSRSETKSEIEKDTITNTLPNQTNSSTELKDIIPENYTLLKGSPANGREMEPIVVDLDNDKKADTAFIVTNENEFSDYLLLIYLTSQNKIYSFKFIDQFYSDFGIFPVQLKVKNDVLEVGYFRDGTAAFGRFFKFRFDEQKKTFRLIGYDSGYRLGAGTHCDKSYNLINGRYIVNFEKSIPNVHTETFKGIKKIEEIYINNIDLDVLNKLDDVGCEFEN